MSKVDPVEEASAAAPSPREPIPILRYTTSDLPPEERYAAWRRRDWPRTPNIFRTEPVEAFDTRWESVALGPVTFIYAEITGMWWERRLSDIRTSEMDGLLVSMMIDGLAHGDADGVPFRIPSGTFHINDLARPSLHVSTASRTHTLLIPRPVMRELFGTLHDLHGSTVTGPAAAMMFAYAAQVHAALPRMDVSQAERLGRVFLELLAVAVEEARPGRSTAPKAEDTVRRRAIEQMEMRLGDGAISVADLCKTLNVSRGRLFAAFKADGGVQAHATAMRLHRAREALFDLERDEPIGSIAHRLSFSDAAHLSRAFRQRYGMSPREYRRLAASNAERDRPGA